MSLRVRPQSMHWQWLWKAKTAWLFVIMAMDKCIKKNASTFHFNQFLESFIDHHVLIIDAHNNAYTLGVRNFQKNAQPNANNRQQKRKNKEHNLLQQLVLFLFLYGRVCRKHTHTNIVKRYQFWTWIVSFCLFPSLCRVLIWLKCVRGIEENAFLSHTPSHCVVNCAERRTHKHTHTSETNWCSRKACKHGMRIEKQYQIVTNYTHCYGAVCALCGWFFVCIPLFDQRWAWLCWLFAQNRIEMWKLASFIYIWPFLCRGAQGNTKKNIFFSRRIRIHCAFLVALWWFSFGIEDVYNTNSLC